VSVTVTASEVNGAFFDLSFLANQRLWGAGLEGLLPKSDFRAGNDLSAESAVFSSLGCKPQEPGHADILSAEGAP
jgi:hypothetical protein